MSNENAIADHWAKGDIYALIVSALEKHVISRNAFNAR